MNRGWLLCTVLTVSSMAPRTCNAESPDDAIAAMRGLSGMVVGMNAHCRECKGGWFYQPDMRTQLEAHAVARVRDFGVPMREAAELLAPDCGGLMGDVWLLPVPGPDSLYAVSVVTRFNRVVALRTVGNHGRGSTSRVVVGVLSTSDLTFQTLAQIQAGGIASRLDRAIHEILDDWQAAHPNARFGKPWGVGP